MLIEINNGTADYAMRAEIPERYRKDDDEKIKPYIQL